MKTIIIYTETFRDASLYTADADDALVYDENIDKYYARIEGLAEQSGFAVEYEGSGSGRSTYSDTDEGTEFLASIPDFWEWYNS